MFSCAIQEEESLLIPDKAIGIFGLHYGKISDFTNDTVSSTPFEDLFINFEISLSDIGVKTRDIINIFGFILPFEAEDNLIPHALIYTVKEYDAVIYNQFTKRNPSVEEIQYQDKTYYFETKIGKAVYSMSPNVIFVANSIVAMDELIEVAYYNTTNIDDSYDLISFYRKNKTKFAYAKIELPDNFKNEISENFSFFSAIENVQCTVDFGKDLDMSILIITYDEEISEGIAAIIDGTSKFTYGMMKLNLFFIEEENEGLPEDLQNALFLVNDLLQYVSANAEKDSVRIGFKPPLSSLSKITQFFSLLESYIEKE